MKKWIGCLLAVCVAWLPLVAGASIGYQGLRKETSAAAEPTPIGYHGVRATPVPQATPIGWRGAPAPHPTAEPTARPIGPDLAALREAFISGLEARWTGTETLTFYDMETYPDSLFQEIAIGMLDDRMHIDLSLYVDADTYWLFITEMDGMADQALFARLSAAAVAAHMDMDEDA